MKNSDSKDSDQTAGFEHKSEVAYNAYSYKAKTGTKIWNFTPYLLFTIQLLDLCDKHLNICP